ncbi:MAG: retropepsin-like aspartic protease [Acetobacteraceae bacterium]|nr:retropepsin-like aspartic protease [Acetobacteraceae bacterium]
MRLLLACLLLFGSSLAAQAACVTTPRATVRLEPVDGVLVVPVEVNGRPARFLLDTGAERTVVTETAVQRLGLARDEWVATSMRGVSGGIERARNADPRRLSLGGVELRRHTMAHDNTLTVATLPRVTPDLPIDGLLGRDFLSVFDLALDLPAGTLTLYDVAGCSGRFLPWKTPYAALPVAMPMDTALVVSVQLDGVTLRALLDTGASGSLVAAPGIARLGLTPARLSGGSLSASGVGPHSFDVQRHRFATLRVGPDTLQAPTLMVAPVRLTPIVDMLLGGDWLAGRRIWLSYATRQVFVAR